MSQRNRLGTGGRIDRKRPLSFNFNGVSFQGFAGDTLASALLGAGQTMVGRSFKYHRPRGVMASGAEEPNALVEISRDAARTLYADPRRVHIRAQVKAAVDDLELFTRACAPR